MRRQTAFLALLFGSLLLAGCGLGVQDFAPQSSTSGSSFLPGPKVSSAQVIEDEFIVGVQAGVDPQAAANTVANRNNGQVLYVYEHAFRGFALKVDSQAVQRIKQNPNVAFVEPNLRVHAIGQTLQNGIDRIEIDQNSTANIDNTDDSMDVDIAIIDTGIDLDHPDLDAQPGKDCIDDGKSTTNDDNGHGTHVAGSAAAIDNTSHVVGAAPGARVHAVKVLDASGSGSIASVVCGVDYVTKNASTFEAANMSLGAQGESSSLRSAIQESVKAGIYYAVAAGNDASDVYGSDGTFGTSDDFIPAAYPEVATVSAMAEFDGTSGGDGGSKILTGCGKISDDTFAECFSNFSQSVVSTNPVNSPGAAIDLAAPGVTVLSTTNDGGTGRKTGTSMSSPHVAGSAALWIAANGNDTNGDGVIDETDVYNIRQTLIDNGQAQTNWQSGDTNDPDSNPEPLVFWGSTSNNPPSVDSLSLSEVETSDSDAEFDAPWDVSDPDGNLDSVELVLTDTDDGETEDTVTVSVSGDTASGTTRLVASGEDGSGHTYEVTATVTDTEGSTDSATATATESEDTTGGNAPTVDSLGLGEDNSGGSPHADFDASWSVSDGDGDLDTVELTLTDLDDGETEATATVDVSGGSASGTTDLKAKHEENSGHEYEVKLVVTDSNGNTDSATATEVEDGS